MSTENKPKTNRELHEEAAGMNLEDSFFAAAGIDPDGYPSSTSKPKAQLGIRHRVVFEVPAGCHVECKTSSDITPAAIVVKGSKYLPGYFYHSVTEGTFGPFGSLEEACLCHPFTDETLKGWLIIVPTVQVEV